MNQVITIERFSELLEKAERKAFPCPIEKCTQRFHYGLMKDFVSHLIQEHQDRLRDIDMVQFLLTEEEMSAHNQ